jgi:hypothetical protein
MPSTRPHRRVTIANSSSRGGEWVDGVQRQVIGSSGNDGWAINPDRSRLIG